MLMTIAMPSTDRNSTGSNHEVVVSVRMRKMMMTASTITRAISALMVGPRLVSDTAEPATQPRSPTICSISRTARWVRSDESFSRKMISI